MQRGEHRGEGERERREERKERREVCEDERNGDSQR